MEPLALRFSRAFLRYRHASLAGIGAVTLFFGFHALQLEVFSRFIDLLPRSHPYIQVYEEYTRPFGSANVVTAAIVAKRGTIYDDAVLEAIYGFTDRIDKMEGVDHAEVTSITSLRVRDQQVDREGVVRSRQILGEEALALLEAQFFARRALRRAEAQGAPREDLASLERWVAGRKTALAAQLSRSAALRLDKLADRERAQRIQALREEAAELEFLALRLDELPRGYRLEGRDLVGPEGSLLPPTLLRALPARIHQDARVHGRLVSLDDSAALVTAGFLEGRLDYAALFDALQRLSRELEAGGAVEVHLAGQPVLVGWTFYYAGEIVLILALTLAILTVLLGLYFRQAYGVVLPLSGAAVSAVWGLGFTRLMGYSLEPLVLVIPMLITARAVSHSVQFVERFYEEYERLRDKEQAVVSSMAELLRPGTLAILTDALGILVVGLCSIALMKKVAVFGAFWALSIAVTEMLLNRLLILYLPAPRSFRHYTPGPVRRSMAYVAVWATGARSSKIVVGLWLVGIAACFGAALRVEVGDSRPGSPILWEESAFNRSARVIGEKFPGAPADLVVFVETERPGGVHRPEVMREIEAFQRYMEQDRRVVGSLSIVDLLKDVRRTFHGDDPRWAAVPATAAEIAGLLYLYEAGSPAPGILDPIRDRAARSAAVRIFYRDHRSETIQAAIARAEHFIGRRPAGDVALRLEAADDTLGPARRGLGPLLPPPAADLRVWVRQEDGRYREERARRTARDAPAPADARQATAGGAALRLAWSDEARGIHAQVRRSGLYATPELWVRYRDGEWEHRASGRWAEGPSFALASGLVGVLAASHAEVARSHAVTLVVSFAAVFAIVLLSYRSLLTALLLVASLGSAAFLSLAFMAWRGIGLDVNTLPVQALGVGVGVDYALYVLDRIGRERQRGHGGVESVRIAVRTTGLAVFFTGSTLVGGIIAWYFLSSLRFAAEMSLLLSILLSANMVGAILVIPACTTLLAPRRAKDAAREAGGAHGEPHERVG